MEESTMPDICRLLLLQDMTNLITLKENIPKDFSHQLNITRTTAEINNRMNADDNLPVAIG